MDIDQIGACQKISLELITQSIALGYACGLAGGYLIDGMRTIEEIRRMRLKDLVDEAGSAAALNRVAGRNERDSTISQILNQATGTSGKPKELGSSMARELETAMHKPRGWMDNDPHLTGAPWPFKEITPEQYFALSDIERARVEERALMMIEARALKSHSSGAA